jgi:hypothetical protein
MQLMFLANFAENTATTARPGMPADYLLYTMKDPHPVLHPKIK